MSGPVTCLLLGKNPDHLKACIAAAQPEFEVPRVGSSVEDAKAAVSELVGDAKSPRVSVIIMGGGFSMDDFEEIWSSAKSVPWLRPAHTAPGHSAPPPVGMPPAEVVATRIRKSLDEHADELQQGKGAGEVWYF